MSERTPKLSTIRHAWAKAHPFPLTTDVEERYAEFDRWLAAHDAEVRAVALAEQGEPSDQIKQLLRDLIDPDDCRFDHHGGCQAHGYLSLQSGELCPHAEAKQLIAGWLPFPDGLPDEEPVDAEPDREDCEGADGAPKLGGLPLRPIAVSDLNRADGARPVLGCRTPVVVLAHGAPSLGAVNTRTNPDRSGVRLPVPDTTNHEIRRQSND